MHAGALSATMHLFAAYAFTIAIVSATGETAAAGSASGATVHPVQMHLPRMSGDDTPQLDLAHPQPAGYTGWSRQLLKHKKSKIRHAGHHRGRRKGSGAGKKRHGEGTVKLAIVNSVTFHLEILMGVLFVCQSFEAQKSVFLKHGALPGDLHNYRFHELINPQYTVRKLPWIRTAEERRAVERQDVVILISPEYNLNYTLQYVKLSQPRLVIAFVHTADMRDHGLLPQLSPNLRLFALAPHVAKNLKLMKGYDAGWILPSPELDMGHVGTDFGFSGFAIPGSIKFRRRNYILLWFDMGENFYKEERIRNDKRFHIHVVGRGRFNITAQVNISHLPAEVAHKWSIHQYVDFPDFYQLLHHRYALLPLFMNDTYTTVKFSSTIAAMLTSGVPILADDLILETYSFLPREAAFYHRNGTSLVRTLLGIMDTPVSQLLAVRHALRRLQRKLNDRAREVLHQLVFDRPS